MSESITKRIEELLREQGMVYQLVPKVNLYNTPEMECVVSTLIYSTESGMVAVQRKEGTRVDENALKIILGVEKLAFASAEELGTISLEKGEVPLVGLDMPFVTDEQVLTLTKIYGGSGSKPLALELQVADMIALNQAKIASFTFKKEG